MCGAQRSFRRRRRRSPFIPTNRHCCGLQRTSHSMRSVPAGAFRILGKHGNHKYKSKRSEIPGLTGGIAPPLESRNPRPSMFHVEHQVAKRDLITPRFVINPTTRQHPNCMASAWEALEGLSLGDAFGEVLSHQHFHALDLESRTTLTPGALRYTDDTTMALGILECLSLVKTINQDALAWVFAKNFKSDPDRGYGKMTRQILTQLSDGGSWRTISASAFGTGLFGNRSAMRVGPLGAYFSQDLGQVGAAATASAQVTNLHLEARAGAIAVAIAIAEAVNCRHLPLKEACASIWQIVINWTPEGMTLSALKLAHTYQSGSTADEVARDVGCGHEISCQDTVPFAIWNACRSIHDFTEALLSTVEVGGDCDTNAAIVCGIVAAYGTDAGIIRALACCARKSPCHRTETMTPLAQTTNCPSRN